VTVTVLLFAELRALAGSKHLELQLPESATVRAAADRLEASLGQGRLSGAMCALNERYVEPGTRLSDGDVVAFLPPVSGG